MRMRMVHQLALLLVATVSLSVLCVATGVLLNLRDGFSDYLHAREAQRAAALPPSQVIQTGATAAPDVARDVGGLDAAFLNRQYRGIVAATAVSLMLSMALAVWVARRWSRQLGVLQEVARDLAAGRFAPTEQSTGGPEEIAQLSQEVTAMAESLRRLEFARRKWMAQISHELRTPLSVLQGEIESVEDGARAPNLALVMNLGEEVRHLVRIVDDLHLLAVADLGSLPHHPIEVDPLECIEYIVERLVRHPSLDGLRVEVLPLQHRPLCARWDPVRIEQVLRNLLGNSARYTARPGRVRLAWTAADDDRVLHIHLDDSAPGVSPDDLPHVFEPLFRADTSRHRGGTHPGEPGMDKLGGSGLGLAIVRAILLAHEGCVYAGSSELGGLAIRVELPMAPTEQGEGKGEQA